MDPYVTICTCIFGEKLTNRYWFMYNATLTNYGQATMPTNNQTIKDSMKFFLNKKANRDNLVYISMPLYKVTF